jgi:tetratricopeptide (TPR) repeat protein
MEFVYTRQIDRGELTAPSFLGLAEIRLRQGNVQAAIELLHRLTLIAGEPFENMSASAALLERLQRPLEALEFRRARVRAVPWDAGAQTALARTELATAQDRDEALNRLAAVVESPNERYIERVEAARAFAAAGGRLGRDTRSELDLLRMPGELTATAAGKPMFVAARVAAAERTPEPATRVNLLLAAVAAAPGDERLRIPLFRAQLESARPSEAIDAVQPLLRRSRSLTNVWLTAADRARLARELGEAHQQVDRLQEAVRFLTIALEGQNAAARAPLRARLATINQEIGRRAMNATRQPHISEALEQPQLVRPRLLQRPQRVTAVAQRPQGGAR